MPLNEGFVEFVLGAAVIALPQYKLPLLGFTGLMQVSKALRKRREERATVRDAAAGVNNGNNGAITLEWSQLDCTLTGKDGKVKHILRDLNGSARPGRLLALMGASGSGKTTLLTALAGQLPAAKGMELHGVITVNGKPRDKSTHRQAFVAQEDIFYSQLTVRETLMMAARLRMAPTSTPEEHEQVVEGLIKRLGLTKVADTLVGDKKKRGLSGGEKKRLGIGCELIGSPTLLFADEPTTGLDAFQAEKVMQTLKQLAADGCTVITSIHQPRSSIFQLFDDLILLSEGAMVYAGPAEEVLPFFEAQGHKCPAHYNPAEFLVDTIAIDNATPEAEDESRDRVDDLLLAFRDSFDLGVHEIIAASADTSEVATEDNDTVIVKGGGAQGSSLKRQLSLLFVRSWRQVTRDKATNVARAMSNISSAVIFGSIFWRMGRSQTSIQDRMGLLQVGAINAAMSSLVKTLNVFPKERVIVERERAKGSYAVLPYFVSKLAAESPIGAIFPLLFGSIVYPACGLNPRLDRFAKFLAVLTLESFTSTALGLAVGAGAPNADTAAAIGPAIMVVFIVFGGYYVNPDNVPLIFRWLPRTSLIKHGFEGLAVSEFPGLTFDKSPEDGAGDLTTGDQVLHRLGFEKSSVRGTLKAQARVLAFNYWVTYCILKARRPKFVHLQPPLIPDAPVPETPAQTKPVTKKPAVSVPKLDLGPSPAASLVTA